MLTNCLAACAHHRLRGSASTVLTATGQVNGRWRILTPHKVAYLFYDCHAHTFTKRWYYSEAHWHLGDVLVSNSPFFVIFAVLDVSLAVNLCINCSFFYIYLTITVSEIERDIGRKSSFFHTPCIRRPRYGGSRLNIATPFGTEKLEWCGYPMVKKFRRYLYSFWRNSRTWQTDRHTDRQTHRHRMTAKTALMHSIAR